MPERKCDVTITGLTGRGQGVGKIKGQVVFVPGGLPGDRVRVAVTRAKKNYLVGRVEKLLEPSAQRVEATCHLSGDCGGCQLQELSYSSQLQWKREWVVEALNRIGGLSAHVLPTLPAPIIWNYRNKAAFPVGYDRGRLVAGCYMPGTHRIVDSEACSIQHEKSNCILRETKNLLRELKVPVYDERSHRGLIRHLVARVAVGTGENMAVLVTKNKRFPQGTKLAKALMDRVDGLCSVVQNVNPAKTNIILGTENRTLAGKSHIDDIMGDDELGRLTFRISPHAFYQVNSAQAVNLYRLVRQYANLQGTETVLDLYCGVGTITLFVAKVAQRVVGVEEVPAAVSDARLNAKLNAIDNAEFLAGRAEHLMPSLLGQGVSPQVIIIDPPRAGCDQRILHAMIQAQPDRLIYVSCYPPTLARDLKVLAGGGLQTHKDPACGHVSHDQSR